MKKALSVLLTMGLTVSMLAGCGSNGAADNASAGNAADNSAADNTVAATESSAAAGEAKSASDIKVGVIYIGDENEGYTAAHMAGIRDVTLLSVQALDMRATCFRQQQSTRRFSSAMQPDIRQHLPDFPICTTILILSTKHVMFPALLRV